MVSNYEVLHVKPETKRKLEKIGTMKDTHDIIINKLIDFYMDRFGEYHLKIQHDFHDRYSRNVGEGKQL